MSLWLGIGLGIIPTAARPGATTAPVNVVKPSFDGILTQGQSADVNPGSWTGLPSPNFTYAIKRSGVTVSTDPEYVWTAADVAAGVNAMTVDVTATNEIGPTTATSDPVTIAAPLALSGSPPVATVGALYSFTPNRTGGHAPFNFELDGVLPTGLSFNTSTGEISGTPVSSGEAELTIHVVDKDGLTAQLGPFSLVVSAGGTSDIISLTIMDATPLDATGDYGDDTARPGVNGNGWVGKVVMPWRVAQTFDPTKIVLTVTDPGFDESGATTVARTIRGGAVLRRQYSAQASRQVSDDGIQVTAYFSLSDMIYAGSGVTGVAEPGFYGELAGGPISGLENTSTRAYPKPLFAWLNAQHDVARGSPTFRWEAVAYHAHMRNGRQVARIEVTAKDTSGNTSAVSVSSATALSQFQTRGHVVECFSGEVALANLTARQLCIANARVYPWIGDESAVLDLVRDGISTSGPVQTANPQTPLRFVCDKDGSYSGAYAYVKAGAVGGVVSANPATARATPFPTINAAVLAIPAWNNTNKGHNDHSGATIRLMDDGAGGTVAHVLTAHMNGAAAGHCFTDIEADPLNTGAVSVTLNAAWRTADLLHWKVKLTQSSATSYLNGNNANGYVRQAASGADLDVTAGTSIPLFMGIGLLYLQNPKFVGVSSNIATCMAGQPTSRVQCALALGVEMDPTADVSIKPFALIGSRLTRTTLFEHPFATIPNWDSVDGMVVANNSLLNCRVATNLFRDTALTRGFAFVQNVGPERAVTGTEAPALQIAGDGATAALNNVVVAYNTIPGTDGGCRANVAYTDADGAAGVARDGFVNRFNIFAELNCKTDTFTGVPPGTVTPRGRVGNWANRYTVGHEGWVSILGDATGAGAAGPETYLGDYLQPSIAPKAGGGVTFADDKSGSAGAGGGTYTLTGASNAAYGRVPAGLAGLSFDLAGNPRRNDGSGAAGAYERAA